MFIGQKLILSSEALLEQLVKELMATIPLKWRQYLGVDHWRIIGEDECTGARLNGDIRRIAIAIQPHEALVSCIKLPLISRFRLPNMIRFEALRHIPNPLDRVRIDFRILSRDLVASRMVVELAVFRIEALQLAEERAKNLKIRPDAIFLSTVHGPWFARRPIFHNWREILFKRRYRKLLLRTVVPVSLVFFLVMAAQNWAARLAADRDSAVIAARSEAVGIEPLRRQYATLNDEIIFLNETRKRPSAAAIAEQVARLLPDDAWLQELDVEDDEVRLIGNAERATDLLKRFSSSPSFGNVQFEAPITQAIGSRSDQFDLVMTRD